MLEKTAQDVAGSTSAIIGYGVLVTDAEGIIIGCDDEGRIGSLHAPSLSVINKDAPQATSDDEASAMKGVRPGYTLPIHFLDRIVGSVSIAGPPSEVERYGLLVQKQAEMMLKEQAVLESSLLRERMLRDLFDNLLSFKGRKGDGTKIIQQGRDLGFNLSKCGAAAAVEMTGWSSKSAESDMRKLVGEIKSVFSNPGNVICAHGDYKISILLAAPASENESIAERAVKLGRALIERASAIGIKINLCAGFEASDLEELASSLRSAGDILRIGSELGRSGLLAADQFVGERLLDMLPEEGRKEFAARTLKGLSGRSDFDDLRNTFLSWCENPFASAGVAEKLSMHRNSLQYRLKKIRTLTGRDPWNFKDAFELWAAFVISSMK